MTATKPKKKNSVAGWAKFSNTADIFIVNFIDDCDGILAQSHLKKDIPILRQEIHAHLRS